MKRTLQTTSLILAVLAAAHAPASSATARETLELADAGQSLELDALIEPFADLNLGAQVDGVLAEILVERGDAIEAGQVLARMESELEERQLELVSARAASTAELDSATAAVELSRQRVKRTRQLYEEKVVSWGVLEEVETELRLAELQQIEAQENHDMAQLDVKRAVALLEQRTIYSPISGVVVERYLGPGEIVYRANRNQVLRVAQIDPLRVEIIAPLSVYGRIGVGDLVKVFPDSPVGGSYEARITVVDRVIDAASGTIGIRCELPNVKHEIPAGLRCRVSLPLREGR